MDEKPKKLVLHQETLKYLVEDKTSREEAFFGTHTCTPTACSPFSCTVAPC